jgi:Family of unknown function (DUF6092)
MMDKTELEEQIFELISYMSVSARNLLEEPARYGPFRLVDAASRLVDVLKANGLESDRLDRVQAKIEEGKYSAMGTEDEFESFLEGLVLFLVEEIGPGLE